MRISTPRTTPIALALLLAGCSDATAPVREPLHIAIVSGAGQTGEAGRELALPLVVSVTGAPGLTLSQKVVNFVVVSGGGSMYAGMATPSSTGQARDYWTLGTDASQPQVVEVRAVNTATGQKEVYARFTAVATPGALDRLIVADGDGQ